MKDDDAIVRIAIATLAATMIGVPILGLAAKTPRVGPGHLSAGLAERADARRRAAHGGEDEARLVSQDGVVALAHAKGLARVTNIVFQDGIWILQGAARDGAPIEVDISQAGKILHASPD